MAVEEVLPGLFRIEVPLPKNPLRSINSYAIRGRERDLIVDTGLALDECRSALRAGLRTAGVDPGRADLFITHMHVDHISLAGELAAPDARVYLGAQDVEATLAWQGWERLLEQAALQGFPVAAFREAIRTDRALAAFDQERFRGFSPVTGGEVLGAGDYRFRCVSTPGHSPGHVCLYEPEAKILLSGDHILDGISPNITSWYPGHNPLKTYLASLDTVRCLEVERVLPGHRQVFRGLARRVDELKVHHDQRLREVLGIVSGGERTAYAVAAEMSWDLQARTWEERPLPQRWFATGEALSHLRYLVQLGRVRQQRQGAQDVFSASDDRWEDTSILP